MSYFDDINGFSNSVQERLQHQQGLAQQLSDSKVKSIKDTYDTIQGAIQAGAGASAGIGASFALTKKVIAARKAKPTDDDAGGDSGDIKVDLEDGKEPTGNTPSGSSGGDAPTGEGSSGAEPPSGSDAPTGGAGAAAEGAEEGAEEGANIAGKIGSGVSKAGQIAADVGEGIADFIDPAGLIISAGLGIASLFEDIFGKKHATGGEEETAQKTAPSQIVGGGEDPTALSASQ